MWAILDGLDEDDALTCGAVRKPTVTLGHYTQAVRSGNAGIEALIGPMRRLSATVLRRGFAWPA